MDVGTVSRFFMMPSFEPRSVIALREFKQQGGNTDIVKVAQLFPNVDGYNAVAQELNGLGITSIPVVDRLNSRHLWEWVWSNTKDVHGVIIIDATCFTRELLGMLLFALSVRRDSLESVYVQYVSTGPKGYATQNDQLDSSQRWLSKGVREIRSILGFPGDFRSERRRRVIAFVGHEQERLLEIIEFLEPSELSISNERLESSTVEGAAQISQDVAKALRVRIPLPNISNVDFSASSIEETFDSLKNFLKIHTDENVAVIAMNTKVSFIGAALAALNNRCVRLVYAVPEEYNPFYSSDVGKLRSFDITNLLKQATTPAQTSPTE